MYGIHVFLCFTNLKTSLLILMVKYALNVKNIYYIIRAIRHVPSFWYLGIPINSKAADVFDIKVVYFLWSDQLMCLYI